MRTTQNPHRSEGNFVQSYSFEWGHGYKEPIMKSYDNRPIDVARKFDDPDFNDLPAGAKTHQNRHPKSPPKGSTADEESLRPAGVVDDQSPKKYQNISQGELDKMPNPDELING